jgi:hypothetical protein
MSPVVDTIEHFVLSCSATEEVCDKFWTSILDIFGIQAFIYLDTLYSLSIEELLYIYF